MLPDFYGRGLRLARSHHASDQWDDAAGLKVMLNSDDPTMFHTDIGKEYVDFCGQNAYGPDVVRELVMNGVDATWLDDGDKATLRAEFEAELAALDAEYAADAPPLLSWHAPER